MDLPAQRHRMAVLVFLAVLACYLSFSPFDMMGMGYTGEEMRSADRILARADAWRKGVPVPPMLWSRHGPVPVLFDIPFVAAGKWIVSQDFVYSFQPVLLSAGLVTLLYLWLRKLASPGMSLLITLTGAFCTMLWPYAYIGLEPKQSFFLMLAGYLGLTRGAIRRWPAVVGFAIVCGLTVSLKSTGLVLCPAVAYLIYFQFRDDWRTRLAQVAAVLAIVGAIYVFSGWGRAHFWQQFGSSGFSTLKTLLTDSPLTYFTNWFGVFGARNKGIFIYAPVIVLALFAFPRVWKTHRDTAIFVLLLVVSIAGELAALRAPADEVWGSRYMHTALAPLLVVIGAARPRFEWRREAPLLALAAIGLAVSFLGSMFYYGQLHFATIKAGENTLEWMAGDSVWNPVQFHARMLKAWWTGRPLLWTPVHYWMYEPPPGMPPPKPIDMHAYSDPQPLVLKMLPAPKAGVRLYGFALLCGLAMLGPLLLGLTWWLTVKEGAAMSPAAEDTASRVMRIVLRPRVLVPAGVVLAILVAAPFIPIGGEDIKLRVTFNRQPPEVTEPILQLGAAPGAADALAVIFRQEGRIVLFFDHWGTPRCESDPQEVRLDQPHEVQLRVNGDNRSTSILLDGNRLMNCSALYDPNLSARMLGKNTFGFTTMRPEFSGKVELLSVSAKNGPKK
jgi:hypothetical protein